MVEVAVGGTVVERGDSGVEVEGEAFPGWADGEALVEGVVVVVVVDVWGGEKGGG